MKDRALRVAGSVFLALGLLQLGRAALGIPVTVAGREMPVALSFVAGPVLLGLAFWMFRATR